VKVKIIQILIPLVLLCGFHSAAHGQEADLPLTPRERMMLRRIEQLETRLAVLEAKDQPPTPPTVAATVQEPKEPEPAQPPEPNKGPDLLHGTTINFLLDTYYEYNFNNPIGRVNYLRAYDVSSNAFSLNQAAIVLENAPDPSKGKSFGARVDLQFGQATQTLQGNPANEPRPDIYRAIFQAYGTYLRGGLTVDVGKWASSLGMENNYTKDQMNYSRSYWFDFLPFYHMGGRVNYKLNEKLSLNYWIVNGTEQTEPFNGFKDQLFGLTIQPHKTVNWVVNYYLGQEHPDVIYYPNGGPPGLPAEQGLPFAPIPNAPKGKLHIFDSYATWQPSSKLTFALEGDYVIERLQTYSAPMHVAGGAVYARRQLTPRFAIAGRAEYLTDRGGLFSGVTQALKETTLTAEYRLPEGFLIRGEWRRDFSNRPYFLTDTLGILKNSQNTATIGLVWWYGGKEGIW
jgi:Putative beta-barrel porin-2, OmpL-like. bbp2